MDNFTPLPPPPNHPPDDLSFMANGYCDQDENSQLHAQMPPTSHDDLVRSEHCPYEIQQENLNGAYQYDQFKKMLAELHFGGSWSYLWYCSEERKARTGENGQLSYTEAKTKRTVWFPTGQVPALSRGHGMNVYFGVHPANQSGKRYQRALKASTKDVPTIQLANCLFAEFDAKDFSQPLMEVSKRYKTWLKDGGSPWDFDASGTGEWLRLGMEAAWLHIQQIGIRPTYIINSGGGFHTYFSIGRPSLLFNEPLQINDETREEFERLQTRFVRVIGSDEGAKDLARVLRVPGTINYKGYYEHQPLVFVIPDENRISHDLDEIRAFVAKKEEEAAQHTVVNPLPMMGQNSLSTKKAAQALKRLSKSRCDSYSDWLNVGMALYHEFDGADWALAMWEKWSKQSDAYEVGATETKWETFQRDGDHNRLGLGSLILWANSDDPEGQAHSELGGLEALLAKINAIDSALELTDKIDDMIELAIGLTSRELTKACKAMRRKGVTSADASQWRRDVKEAKAEAKQKEKEAKQRKDAEPAEINGYMVNQGVKEMRALFELGYFFQMNQCNDDIEVSNESGGLYRERLSDGIMAKIRAQMRGLGFKSGPAASDAYQAFAYDYAYHPVREYLLSLQWDGYDWIRHFADHLHGKELENSRNLFDDLGRFTNDDGILYTWPHAMFRRWLIGACQKVFGEGQNMMLVHEGINSPAVEPHNENIYLIFN